MRAQERAVQTLPLQTMEEPAGGLADPWAQYRDFQAMSIGRDPTLSASSS